MSGKLAMAYATASEFFVNEPIRIDAKNVNYAKKDYDRKQVFGLMFWGALIVFIMAIVANSTISMYYMGKIKSISTLKFKKDIAKNDLVGRQEKVVNLEILRSGIQRDRDIGYYLDELYKPLGKYVFINELILFPYLKSSRVDQPLIHNQNLIEVKGSCMSIVALNAWTDEVKKLKDVKEIQLNLIMTEVPNGKNFIITIILN